jgi:hypothetical protein
MLSSVAEEWLNTALPCAFLDHVDRYVLCDTYENVKICALDNVQNQDSQQQKWVGSPPPPHLNEVWVMNIKYKLNCNDEN